MGCLQGNEEYNHMDRIALKAGTDKSSNFHNYTEVYSQYFAELRNKPITFLEIGIYKGHSVMLWEKYFPHAELHFIDISDTLIEYYTPRAQYHFIDQADIPALQKFAKDIKGGFDIIIDDGGHLMSQQINSFKALFPYLKSGGLYIVEDLHTSYWQHFGGQGDTIHPQAGPGTAIEFLTRLVDDLNYTGAATTCADWKKTPSDMMSQLNDFQKNIYSIQFYKSLCIIKKR